MVHIEETVVRAARHNAAFMVAAHHGAPRGRWNRLAGARRRPRLGPHVGAWGVGAVFDAGAVEFVRTPDLLSIARRHLADDLVDGVALSARVDARSPALVAPRDRHLVARAAFVGWPSERATCHLVEQGVVVDLATEIGAHRCLEVAEQRHRLAPDLEDEPMLDQRRIRPVVGTVPPPSRCHRLLDLLHAPALRPGKPSPLGLRSGHSRELADRRPGELPGGEGAVE
jgi:hypothetical protein